jgi:hypothetical protein
VLKSTQADLLAGCGRIAEDVVRSPALLGRPAALCRRLGLCQASCSTGSSSTPGSAAGSNASQGEQSAQLPSGCVVRVWLLPGLGLGLLCCCSHYACCCCVVHSDAIDMCSPTGLASGSSAAQQQHRTIDRAAASEGSVCLSSADCPSSMDCDTFTRSECWSTCDAETGMDT